MKTKSILLILFAALLIYAMGSCIIYVEPPKDKVLSGTISITPAGESILGTKLTAVYNGPEDVSFQWNRNDIVIANAAEKEFTPLSAGSYTVTVSANGYISKISDSVSIVPPTPVLQKPVIELPEGIGKDEVPLGTILTAKYGGTETVTFQWNKDGTAIADEDSEDFTPAETGVYTVTVSADGCISNTSDSVTVVPIIITPTLEKPVIELPQGIDKDNVPLGTKLTAIYGGTETVTFKWNKDGTAIADGNSKDFTPAETGIYTVTVSADGFNSNTSDSVTVVPPTPVLQKPVIELPEGIGKDDVPLGTILTAIYGGTETVTFQWNKDGTAVTNENSINFTPAETGIYTVTVSAEGCISSTSDSVTVVPIIITPTLEKPVIELPQGISKDNVPLGTILTAIYGGTEIVAFQWNKNGTAVTDEDSEDFTPTETGVYTVTVNAEGCISNTSDSVTVMIQNLNGNISITLPEGVNASNVLTTMPLTAHYTGIEAVLYQWFKDDAIIGNENETVFTPDEAGVYKVKVSVYGYEDKTSLPVTVTTFVPVTGITGIIEKIPQDTATAIGGVVNSDASFKDIIWTISSDNQNSAAIINAEGKLIAADFGIITLTATIKNGMAWGSDFTDDYTVAVETFVILNITLGDTNFGISDVGKAIITGLGTSHILSASNKEINLLIDDNSLTNINWYLGNIILAENTDAYSLKYAAFNSGTHTVTVFFMKDGKQWSGSFNFQVQ